MLTSFNTKSQLLSPLRWEKKIQSIAGMLRKPIQKCLLRSLLQTKLKQTPISWGISVSLRTPSPAKISVCFELFQPPHPDCKLNRHFHLKVRPPWWTKSAEGETSRVHIQIAWHRHTKTLYAAAQFDSKDRRLVYIGLYLEIFQMLQLEISKCLLRTLINKSISHRKNKIARNFKKDRPTCHTDPLFTCIQVTPLSPFWIENLVM